MIFQYFRTIFKIGIFGNFSGPQLRKAMYGFGMVYTHRGLMTIGGDDGGYLSDMTYLDCSGSSDVSTCSWEEFGQRLEVARSRHVVIPLGDSYAHDICDTGMSGNTF